MFCFVSECKSKPSRRPHWFPFDLYIWAGIPANSLGLWEHTQIPTSNIHPSLYPGSWGGLFYFWSVHEKHKSDKGVEGVLVGEVICLPITAPLRLHLKGQWAQQKEDFKTSASPLWTLFIALRKALPAVSLQLRSKPGYGSPPSHVKQRSRLHLLKPHYSHL